jgi:hypothetical protein
MDNIPTPPPGVNNGVTTVGPLENMLAIGVLLFGFLILCLILYQAYRCKYSASETLRFVTVSLIIVATLFVVSAGFSPDHVAPAMGLFGTIAGYLLGRGVKKKGDEDE